MESAKSDLLGTALAPLRVTGTTLLHEEYAPPWSVAVPSSSGLGSILELADHRQAVAFHLVRKGQLLLRAGREQLRVRAGEMAIVFGGGPHTLGDGAPVEPLPVERLIGRNRPERGRSSSPDGTRLVCGVFVVDHPRLNPLFASLPSVTVARANDPAAATSPVADLLVRELDRPGPGASYAIARLVELLCLEVLRACASDGAGLAPGFLRGLSDTAVARAMRAVLERPGAPVSVTKLARVAGLSPSRFAARFRETVGASPIEFAARWRVDVAARWLATTDWSIGEIAGRVGYESPAAFSRAFSRIAGRSPKSWRAATRAPKDEVIAGSAAVRAPRRVERR